jgi:hypothetical protein
MQMGLRALLRALLALDRATFPLAASKGCRFKSRQAYARETFLIGNFSPCQWVGLV